MKLAVIGTGRMAERHLGVFARITGHAVVGHVSASQERADAQAGRWGGRGYTEIVPMLERERPDAAWLCVLPDRHGATEAALIEHDIPFFVEKPLAVDLETPRHIAALLARQSLGVGVGYKFRAMETAPRIRALLAERPARMLVGAWHGGTPALAWWQDEARSGGQVVEQSTHLVDTARFFMGDGEVVSAAASYAPRSRYPECTIAGGTAALLQFAGTVPMTLTTTCVLASQHALFLQFICEGRLLTVSDTRLRIEDERGAEEIPVTNDLFQAEDMAFLHAVREGDPRFLLSSYADALRTHELCVTIARMARE